jgi:hypothetical protein
VHRSDRGKPKIIATPELERQEGDKYEEDNEMVVPAPIKRQTYATKDAIEMELEQLRQTRRMWERVCRTAAIITSLIIALAIAATISVGLGVLIALACGAYQLIYDYGRSETGSGIKTVRGAYMCVYVGYRAQRCVPGSPLWRTDRRFVVRSAGNHRGVWNKPYDEVRSVVGYVCRAI